MDIGLLIDNEDVAATSRATFERRDPVTGDVATRAPAATPEDAVRAADSAAAAAVRIANDTEYGLSSGIFSADVKRALDIARRLEFGCCHINGPTVQDEPQMPLGGMKASGYGRFGGQPGIDAFTEIQWVTVEDPNQHYPF